MKKAFNVLKLGSVLIVLLTFARCEFIDHDIEPPNPEALTNSIPSNYKNESSRCTELSVFFDSLLVFELPNPIEEIQTIVDESVQLNCFCVPQAYNYLGYLNYNVSNINEAKEQLLMSEKAYLIGQDSIRYYALNKIYLGLVHILEQDFESALINLQRGTQLAVKSKDGTTNAFANLNLGLIHLERQNYDTAKAYYQKVLETKSANPEHLAYAYLNLARISFDEEDYKQTSIWVDKSKQEWTRLNHKKGLYFLSFLESRLYLKKEQYNPAYRTLVDGRKQASSIGLNLLNGQNYLLEASIHKQTNKRELEATAILNGLKYTDDLDFNAISSSIKRLKMLSPNIKSDSLMNTLLGLMQKHEEERIQDTKIDIKKQELFDDEQDKKNEIATNYSDGLKTIKKQYIFIGILVLFFLLLSGLLVRLWRQSNKIQSLNLNLKASNALTEEQLKQLEQRNVELKQFAYLASHDLKSPLRTISSFTELIESKLKDKELLEYVQFVKSSSHNMTLLITDLLGHATLETSLNIAKTNFKSIVDISILNLQSEINQKQAVIQFSNELNLNFNCDRVKITQVVQNLIANAINYSKENTPPIIEISAEKQSDFFTFSIKDNGIGIEQQFQDRIFDMFHRLKEKRQVAGSGIGLATCKKVVELHKGSITVVSAPDQGSTFTVKIRQ